MRIHEHGSSKVRLITLRRKWAIQKGKRYSSTKLPAQEVYTYSITSLFAAGIESKDVYAVKE